MDSRWIITAIFTPATTLSCYLCAGYKRFFHHIDRPLKILAQLLRRGLAAEQVMRVLAQGNGARVTARSKIGRNAPCPCGSGLKFKKCHGRLGDSGESKAGPTPVPPS